jgi:predicted DNA-binding protein
MLTLRLPPELEKRLVKFARRTGQSKSRLAREAVIARIDDLERKYLPRRRTRRSAAKTRNGRPTD